MRLSELKSALQNVQERNSEILYLKKAGDEISFATAKKGIISSWNINIFSEWATKLRLYWNEYVSNPIQVAKLLNEVCIKILETPETISTLERKEMITLLEKFSTRVSTKYKIAPILQPTLLRLEGLTNIGQELLQEIELSEFHPAAEIRSAQQLNFQPHLCEQQNPEKAELEMYFYTTYFRTLGLWNVPPFAMKKFINDCKSLSKQEIDTWVETQINEAQSQMDKTTKREDQKLFENNNNFWEKLRETILQDPEFISLLEEGWDLTKTQKKWIFQENNMNYLEREACKIARRRVAYLKQLKEQKEHENTELRLPKADLQPEAPNQMIDLAHTVVTSIANNEAILVIENAAVALGEAAMAAADMLTPASDTATRLFSHATTVASETATTAMSSLTRVTGNLWKNINEVSNQYMSSPVVNNDVQPHKGAILATVPDSWPKAMIDRPTTVKTSAKKHKRQKSAFIKRSSKRTSAPSAEAFIQASSSSEDFQLNQERWGLLRNQLILNHPYLPSDWDLSAETKQKIFAHPQCAKLAQEIAENCNRLYKCNRLANKLQIDHFYDPIRGERELISAVDFLSFVLNNLRQRPKPIPQSDLAMVSEFRKQEITNLGKGK